MSIEPDPYRVLGLDRSASGEEIRRAYRRLAKENHPDSAGEKALPRFLAIQAAYELLAGGPATRRTGARTSSQRQPARDAWRAEPDRARTTRDNSRRPGRAGWGSGSETGPAETGLGGAAGGAASEPGKRSSSAGPRSRPRPAGAGGPKSAGTNTKSGSAAADGAGSPPRPGERPRRDGRKRGPNKATLGSTSYDAAEDEPFEPEWSGGTWYGASSGTYWTLNPKEYADPRKHGPEYQARARRRSSQGAAGSPKAAAREAPIEEGAREADPAEPIEPTFSDTASAGPASADDARPDRAARPPRGANPAPAHSDGLDPFAAAADVAMGLAATPRGLMARIGLALIGWPAIGLALTSAAGELTGCGRFAASCVDLFGVGTWLAQLVIIVVLLGLPSVAALSAVGSLVALAASVPTAVILSATGGSHEPATSATILGIVLVIAYATGVVVAVLRRRYLARLP